MGYIDLHVHSTASDGSLSPDELVKYACDKGLVAFALTDHDTVAGIPSAISAARDYPIYVIPGVEITSKMGSMELHILGYNVDYEDPNFQWALRVIRSLREERNLKICSQLHAYDINIDYEALKKETSCHMITRQHFASYLIRNGYVNSKAEAFDKYLAAGRPCYVPLERISASDAILVIRNAGGMAVLAHPKQYALDRDNYLKLFTVLKGMGLSGIEAIYSTHSYEDETLYKSLADELGLFITGGSDYHGELKPDIDLGTGKGNLMISQSLLENLYHM